MPHTKKGQALLIILLTMAVIMTVVLSVVSYSTTDIAVSTKEEEALRAFSAAEAGVERAFISSNPYISGSVETGASFNAQITNIAEDEQEYVFPGELSSGEAATFWFVSHDPSGRLTCTGLPCTTSQRIRICWGEPGQDRNSSTTPAIVSSFIYASSPLDFSTTQVVRGTADPNETRNDDNFFGSIDSTNCTIAGQQFEFEKVFDVFSLGVNSYSSPGGLLLSQIMTLYNSTPVQIGIDVSPGGGYLPGQGRLVESTGTSGDATRRVQVYKLYPNLPSIFSGVFSQTDLVK